MDSTVEFYYNRAKKLFNDKEYEEALMIVEKAITLENDNVSCWLLVTEIYIELNQFKNASSSSLTVLNFDSKCARAWYLRARVLLGLIRYKEALIASDKSLKFDKYNDEFKKFNVNIRNFIKKSASYQQKEINNSNFNYSNDNPSSNAQKSSDHQDDLKTDFEFNPENKYDNIFRVINSKNIKLFGEKKINSKIYYSILDNIMNDVLKNINNDEDIRIYNKLLSLTSYFAELQFKSEGEELGSYSCNVIRIDDRGKTSQKIAIILHELSHHLLSEILEQMLMYYFNSVKTDAIEAFAWYSLNFKDEQDLMNEYCAHTVENYFMPYNYDNYESFNNVLKKFDLNNPDDIKKINHATTFGNTFSQDIIYMLNKFINDKLKKEIKKQYISDGFTLYRFLGTEFKTKSFFDDETKFNLINKHFAETIVHIKTHFAILDLINYKNEFNKVNKRR